MPSTIRNSSPDDDAAALGREVLGLLKRAGLRERDLSLPAEVEARHRVAAAAALNGIVRLPRRRRFPVSGAKLRGWLGIHFAFVRGRFLVLAAVPATTAVVVALVLGLMLPGASTRAFGLTPPMLVFTGVEVGTVPLRGGPAALELHQLADAAAAQPDQPVQDVQLIQTTGWWLTTTVGSRKPGGPSTLDPVSLDMYYLPDGNVRAIERRGKPLDPAQGLVDPVGEWVKLSDETFESRKEGSQYVQTLPTEPQALTAELVPHPNRCNNATWCLANQIAQLHYSYVVPSGVEAAMWDALASAPGVEFLGHASDRLGRNAVAFVTDGDGPIRQTIIFADRDTGAFLGTEVILIKDSLELGVDSPAVIEFTALVGARWTDIDNLPPLP